MCRLLPHCSVPTAKGCLQIAEMQHQRDEALFELSALVHAQNTTLAASR